MRKIIAVDIGNTWVHFVVFANDRVVHTDRMATSKARAKKVKNILLRYRFDAIAVCSVVPKVSAIFMNLKQIPDFRKKIKIIGYDIDVPIVSHYDRKKVGMDRLVSCFAARIVCPGSRFVIDFGTAITFDVLSKAGEYEGGFIMPGVGSTLQVLSQCALLPKKIELRESSFKSQGIRVPRDTDESIQRGLKEGFESMITSFVHKYAKSQKVSLRVPVVITGGDAKLFLPHLRFPFEYEPYLVTTGLRLLIEKTLPLSCR